MVRRRALAAATLVLVAGPFVLAFRTGGFFDGPRVVALVVAWGLVAVVAVAHGDAVRLVPRDRAARLALAGLALLAAWTAVSATWAPIREAAVDDVQRVALYLGALVAAAALLRPDRALRALEPAALAGVLAMATFGMSDRLFPWLLTLDRHFAARLRLEQPLTYWNAMGLVCAIGLVLAARLAGDRTRSPALRVAAAATGAPLGLALYLTFSRGALAAAGVGAVVLLAAAPTWTQLRAAAVVLEAAVLAAALGSLFGAIERYDATYDGRVAQSFAMLAVLAVVVAGAAAFQAWACRAEAAGVTRMGRLPLPRRTAWLAGALVAVAAAGFVAASARERSDAPAAGATGQRLASLQSNRYEYWRVALDTWADHPVAGVGTGGFRVEWRARRTISESALDAHSLYLETAAELGLVGLLALALAFGGMAGAARRALRAAPEAAAGPVAVVVTWAFHAGLDWDWEMPALTLIALLFAGALLALADRARA
ncbi:MAG TPA: O-antigen ligase family protein [Solirubrobacteraceae bacterium]|nr:O-antigen ligase family protein [Solirubrobacteraceae bacterium]